MATLFVSHASEDKNDFVRPLAHALKAHGLQVWFDELSLRAGDSLRRSIDKGLSECDAGVLVLSPAFFRKQWPQRELDALFSLEIAERATLIPIWYQIGVEEVLRASPLLADRVAISADRGISAVASEIAKRFQIEGSVTSSRLVELIERFQYPGFFNGEAMYQACLERFLRMNAFKEDYCAYLFRDEIQCLIDDDLGDFPPEVSEKLEGEQERLRLGYGLPRETYLTIDEPIREDELRSWSNAICSWVAGTMEKEESAEFVSMLDQQEFDEYFVLLGVPNFAISSEQRDLLEIALVEMGCGLENDFQSVRKTCNALRDIT
ncbi:MAG: toll/interleukin-1 receptor domain-containing protein [Hydrogenophaga sp.]|uniref:toll/interleukin-1 receptor domain-containing protein n=1 Tax=Hydrogenophaga sp. TaxID=1904254 RepID=UPI0025BEF9BB|nr:toll/interleukin-1 receptor domain-containing protein [Hydrogenophaga sp.]MBT9552376.1 toll/interleukin-1 receptor domain-containing protein [Hydrogenophaga sp.]